MVSNVGRPTKRLNLLVHLCPMPDQPSLLFIPDISGFTQFVHETEILHSGHIVAELLELLIDSDQLGMTVSEIEGDAILFYKHQHVPAVGQVISQAEEMFIRFHTHLKRYETERVCQCGACRTAVDLTLKIIVHAGPIGFIHVKNHHKPYGKEVILVHRLLKNELDSHEYLLLTEGYCGQGGDPRTLPGKPWMAVLAASAAYEEAGAVPFHCIPLHPLHARVPQAPPVLPLPRSARPVVGELYIGQAPAVVHSALVELASRTQWEPMVKAVAFDQKKVNRLGTHHVCLLEAGALKFKTVRTDAGPGTLVYGEQLLNPGWVMQNSWYYLLDEEGGGARVRLEVHYRHWPLGSWLLDGWYRKTAAREVGRHLQLLKAYCERIGG
jgi:hypothetical protein